KLSSSLKNCTTTSPTPVLQSSPENAARYTEAIVTYCEGLTNFPHRGSARDDIRSGLRTIGYKKRVIIAFAVLDDTVAILGIFYGGRDYETILAEANDE